MPFLAIINKKSGKTCIYFTIFNEGKQTGQELFVIEAACGSSFILLLSRKV